MFGITHYTNTLKVYIGRIVKYIVRKHIKLIFVGGLMSVEITKTYRDGTTEIQNYIKVENGTYTHRQIEKIDGKVFMRCKSRKLFESIDST